MKKTNLIKSILMVACCVFFMAGCQNNAVADDGTDIRDYSKIDTDSDDSGSGGGGAGGNGLFVCDYNAETDFRVFSWADTIDFSEGADGGIRITTLNSNGWFGGGLAQQDGNNTPNLTFENGVTKIIMQVRGNLKANFYYILPSDGDGATNEPKLVMPKSETEWQDVEIPITKKVQVSTALAINHGGQSSWQKGGWIEVRKIDWVDNNGKSVSIIKK